MNPYADSDTRSWVNEELVGLEGGEVTLARSHTSGDDVSHHIEVKPDTMDQSHPADVVVGQRGDIQIPTEGSRVLIGYRVSGRPIVFGERYSDDDEVPDFEPGERVVGHPLSSAHIRLAPDGSITVEDDAGSKVKLQSDGTIVLNDGTSNPITNISTNTDGEGHVTSVDTTKSTDIFVP